MAVPINFPDANVVLKAPEGLEDVVSPLQLLLTPGPKNTDVFFSCWELTPEELAEIASTGRIWAGVMVAQGCSTPPIYVSGVKPYRTHIEVPNENVAPLTPPSIVTEP